MRRPGAGEVFRAIALGIGRLMGWSAAGYTFLVVIPAYLQTSLNASFQQALIATVLANLGFAAPSSRPGCSATGWGAGW